MVKNQILQLTHFHKAIEKRILYAQEAREKMRICYISDLYPPYLVGGAESYLSRLARTISKHAEVVVVTTVPQARLTLRVSYENGVKIYRFHPMNLFGIYDYPKKMFLSRYLWHIASIWNPHTYHIIKSILSKEKPDVVHTHNFKGLSASVFSAIRSGRYLHVHTTHDYNLISPWSNLIRAGRIIERFNLIDKLYMKFMKSMTRSIDIIVSPSNFAMDLHKKLNFFRFAQKRVITNGITLNRRRLRKNFQNIKVLYVGSMSLYKGVHVLINAFKRCRDPKLHLSLVGRGSDYDYLKELAYDDKRITFHGIVPDSTLEKLYEESSFVVVPSIWNEVLPVVIQEAMSYGTPVIASATGGIPEIMIDGFNGFLFKPGDIKGLARLIKRLSDNSHVLSKLSKNCLAFSEYFDMRFHTKSLFELYRNLIEKRKRLS